jgi:anti-repressor protein
MKSWYKKYLYQVKRDIRRDHTMTNIENVLVKVEVTANQEQIVSMRDVYEALGIGKDFTNWFKQQTERLNLTEGRDFTPFRAESTGGRPSTDFLAPIDIAKNICLISNGPKAQELRTYLIEVEKAWNSPEKIMARALQFANTAIEGYKTEVAALTAKIGEDKPKVTLAEAITATEKTILIGDLAKILKQNGVDIGRNRLFKELRDDGYLMKSGSSWNRPTQRSMDQGLFEVEEYPFIDEWGEERIGWTTKVTPKGQLYFVNLFLNALEAA